MPQPSELRFGVVRAVGRGIAVLDGGQRSLTGRGGFRGFALHFPNGKCRCVADGKMFPIRMRKRDNIYVRQTIRGLFGDILSFNIKLGVYENLAKR